MEQKSAFLPRFKVGENRVAEAFWQVAASLFGMEKYLFGGDFVPKIGEGRFFRSR